jgi:hypothetical protein
MRTYRIRRSFVCCYCRLCAVMVWFLIANPGYCNPNVSEIMVNPAQYPDSLGEYIEVFNASSNPYRDLLYIAYIADTIFFDTLSIPAKSFVVLCSSPNSPSKLSCIPRQYLKRSLPNTMRSVTVQWAGAPAQTFELPTIPNGKSLENAALLMPAPFEQDSLGLLMHQPVPKASWQVATEPLGQDQGTPGYASPQHQVIKNTSIYDFSIESFRFYAQPRASLSSTFADSAKGKRLSLQAPLDSQALGAFFADPIAKTPPYAMQFLYLQLHTGDLYPLDDTMHYVYFKPDSAPLQITEINPCPQNDEPEWIELWNRSAQAIELDYVRLSTATRQSTAPPGIIKPNQRILFTQDSAGFRAVRGALGVSVMELTPWPTLINENGELHLQYGTRAMQSVVWGKHENCTDFPVLTPGYNAITPKLVAKVKSIPRLHSRTASLKIEYSLPKQDSLHVKVYSLGGGVVHQAYGQYPTTQLIIEPQVFAHMNTGPFIILVKIHSTKQWKKYTCVLGP